MQRLRFTIKDLFGTVAFCSFVGWCVSHIGFDNGVFWASMVASAILSGIFVYLAKEEKRRRLAPLAPIPVFVCCLAPFASISIFSNALLLFIAGVYCACRPPLRVRTLMVVAMLCTTAAYFAGVLAGIFEVRKLLAMRQEFPVVSLESRLQYERPHRKSANADILVVNAAVLERLRDFEGSLDVGKYKQYQLEKIHDHQYELFVRAIGFGVGRMLRPMPEMLRKPPLQNIPFDAGAVAESEYRYNDWRAYWRAGKSTGLKHLHTVSRNDFLDADSFGASMEPLLQVVGFVEHGFHYSPAGGFEDPGMWNIVRLELVSLLRFDEPRVYVLDRLPRMDQLSDDDVPTRLLDGFESDALQQLQTEEDLVITHQGSEYRMLGSLRAAGQCVDCHSVGRGELLGAFSYALHRAGTSEDESGL